VAKGAFVCRKGDLVDHWIGVTEGLVKVAMVNPSGKLFNAVVVPAPGWFGEGSVLKDEPRRYDAIALRDSLIACMPRACRVKGSIGLSSSSRMPAFCASTTAASVC
jgi:CRP-like cAMP-binding protein